MTIKHNILRLSAKISGGIALLVFILSAAVFCYNNGHRIESFHAPAGKMLVPEKSGCHFSVMGDSVVNTTIFSAIFRQATANHPDFVLLLGDLVPRHDQQIFNVSARQYKKIIQNQMICPVPGNHDVSVDGKDSDHLRHYRTIFGPGSYFFTYGDTLFYAFDNSRLFYSESDFQEMLGVLACLRPKFRHFVFYMHVPPSTAISGQRRAMMDKTNSDRLEKQLAVFRPTVIFCGHLHRYVRTEYAGAPLYVVRASGQGSEWGYFDVTLDGGNAVVKDIPCPVPQAEKRVTLFPDYEEFKLVQICTSPGFLLVGGIFLLTALLLLLIAKHATPRSSQ